MWHKFFKNKAAKYGLGLGLAVLGLAVIGLWLFLSVQIFYQGKIYPGVLVGDLALGGRTAAEAKSLLTEKTKTLNQGVEFSFQDKKIVISPSSVSFDGDFAYQLFAVNAEATAQAALAVGRNSPWFEANRQKFVCWLFTCRVALAIDYNQPKIIELLKQEFSDFESPFQDAQLNWQANGEWTVSQEKFGRRFDYQAVAAVFLHNLRQAKNTPIKLILEDEAPRIFNAEIGDLTEQINKFLQSVPLTFRFEDRSWLAQRGDMRSWLGLKAEYQNGQKNIVADIDEGLLEKYFTKEIADKINQSPLEAKFVMQDGRVSLFQNSRAGQAIDSAATAQNLRQALAENKKEVMITVKVTEANISGANTNELGIEEIIGTGTSSFAGSPANRRHNIKVGAVALNGLLIQPGEEFSLLKALGEINAEAGYLPELVIKQNKTIPEYGGGLCQIGTTAFRAVFNSGLPVTMRRNHSYRVQYYEPAGTDATIYNPWPDFKFINDTARHILIQTRLAGDTVIFDFWGKKDGRQIEVGRPVIYNIVKPPATKIVETLDLKPGEKKCTEKAHNGASAYFDYKVIYPSGEIKEERFSSYYVPWQEVCLVGVEKLSDPTADSSVPAVNPDAAQVIAPTSTTP